ncbi:uncharacterized protein METZ01_LOCUS349923 [marine metagenome]|uniref:Uncharacterized protein n=1 Tax=marine metagenome TaxID=408172 RepID=A0A382RH83_9ZZZZ
MPHLTDLKFLVRTGVDGLRTLVLNSWLKVSLSLGIIWYAVDASIWIA